MLRAILAYVVFNLALNAGLALTRHGGLLGILEMRHLPARLDASHLLIRHLAWHRSWLDERNVPELVTRIAVEEGVPPSLLKALVEVESTHRPHAISPAGACGLAQLMPDTAEWLGVADPFDPRENLSGAARYLARLMKQFDGDLSLSLAAYNAGPGAVLKAGGIPPYGETRRYVARILGRYRSE